MPSSAAPVLLASVDSASHRAPRPYLAVCNPAPSEAPLRAAEQARSQILAAVPALRRRAWRWCRNHSEAEDLVQETLLRAIGVERVFHSQSHLSAWLYTVLRNLFISRRRRERSLGRAVSQLTDAASDPSVRATPAAPFLTPSVQRALANLPEAFSAVVRLVDLEEHSYGEAAVVLGIPIGTVMSRLFRGRQRLARELVDPQPG